MDRARDEKDARLLPTGTDDRCTTRSTTGSGISVHSTVPACYPRQRKVSPRLTSPPSVLNMLNTLNTPGVVPFLALVEQKSGGPLRLHAGAVGAGVDVAKSMAIDDVTVLATGPLTGSIAAVGTSDGDVVAFDCVTGDVFPGDFGDLSNESVGEKVLGVALAPWDFDGIEGERGALLVAATASKAAAYVLRYGHLD